MESEAVAGFRGCGTDGTACSGDDFAVSVVLDVAGVEMRFGVEVAGVEEMPPLPWELPWAFSLGLLSFEISRMLFREPAGTKGNDRCAQKRLSDEVNVGHVCGCNRAAEQPLCRCPMAERRKTTISSIARLKHVCL